MFLSRVYEVSNPPFFIKMPYVCMCTLLHVRSSIYYTSAGRVVSLLIIEKNLTKNKKAEFIKFIS